MQVIFQAILFLLLTSMSLKASAIIDSPQAVDTIKGFINDRDESSLVDYFKIVGADDLFVKIEDDLEDKGLALLLDYPFPEEEDEYFERRYHHMLDIACHYDMKELGLLFLKQLGKKKFVEVMETKTSCRTSHYRAIGNKLSTALMVYGINMKQSKGRVERSTDSYFACMNSAELCRRAVDENDKRRTCPSISNSSSFDYLYKAEYFFTNLSASSADVLVQKKCYEKGKVLETNGQSYRSYYSAAHLAMRNSKVSTIITLIKKLGARTIFEHENRFISNRSLILKNTNLSNEDRKRVYAQLADDYSKIRGYQVDTEGVVKAFYQKEVDLETMKKGFEKQGWDAKLYDPELGVRLLEIHIERNIKNGYGEGSGPFSRSLYRNFWDYFKKLEATRSETDTWLD